MFLVAYLMTMIMMVIAVAMTVHVQDNGRVGEVTAETLYHRDDALLYIAYVMLIGAAPIPADRWHCSLWP